MRIRATIYVEPIGKARPRHRKLGDGRIIDYLPEPTLTAQGLIQNHIRQIVMQKGKFEDGTPIRLAAVFYRRRPKSTPKRKIYPTTKPDIDNMYKLLSDALNKFVYRDDSQVTTLMLKKRFGDPPRIEILLTEDKDGRNRDG